MPLSSDEMNTLYCSFCGKSQHEVKKLIAGPNSNICDECVELCTEIVAPDPDDDPSGEAQRLRVSHEKWLERTVRSLAAELEAILSDERRRHAPYEKLEKMVDNVQHHLMFESPPKESKTETGADTVPFPSPAPMG